MSRGAMYVSVILVIAVTVLSVRVWQLEQANAEQKKINEKLQSDISNINQQLAKQEAVRGSDRVQLLKLLQEVRTEMKNEVDKKYKSLKRMIEAEEERRTKQEGRMLSLHEDLVTNVIDFKEEQKTTVAGIDHKIEESQRQTNESIVGLTKVFVEEITEWKLKTSTLNDTVQQLASRKPAMIENKVVVETNYHMQTYDSQMSLGERIGKFVGGMIQEGASAIVSWLTG